MVGDWVKLRAWLGPLAEYGIRARRREAVVLESESCTVTVTARRCPDARWSLLLPARESLNCRGLPRPRDTGPAVWARTVPPEAIRTLTWQVRRVRQPTG